MGNLCSKSENKPDNFAGQGRVVGAPNSQNAATSAPVPQKITTNTPGRTLGGRDGAQSPDEARAAAARAAEARNASNKPTGKLGSQLSAQKKQTQNQLLNASSEQERRTRDADATAQAQAYN